MKKLNRLLITIVTDLSLYVTFSPHVPNGLFSKLVFFLVVIFIALVLDFIIQIAIEFFKLDDFIAVRFTENEPKD